MAAPRKRPAPGVHTGEVCGAKTRAAKRGGAPCQRPAGWGTKHLGYGACKLHLGSTRVHSEKAQAQMVQDELRQALGVPVLVGHADRDTIRHVTRAVIAALDLTVEEHIHAWQVLERELEALQTVTIEQARRIDERERRDRIATDPPVPHDPSLSEVSAQEEEALADLARPVSSFDDAGTPPIHRRTDDPHASQPSQRAARSSSGWRPVPHDPIGVVPHDGLPRARTAPRTARAASRAAQRQAGRPCARSGSPG